MAKILLMAQWLFNFKKRVLFDLLMSDKLHKYDTINLIHFCLFFMTEKLDICMSTEQQSLFYTKPSVFICNLMRLDLTELYYTHI